MTEPQPGQEPEPGQGQESTTPEPGQEPESKTYAAEYVKSLRDENAKTRKRLRELEEKEEAEKKARMGEVERAKAEQEEASKSAASHLSALRAERLSNTAERLAVKLGGKPERAEGIARLAELSGVEFGEDNKPDTKQVEAAIKTTLEEYPELRASKAVLNDGFNPAPDELETGEKNPFVKGPHFNLTKQGELYEKNSQLASKLQKAAKG